MTEVIELTRDAAVARRAFGVIGGADPLAGADVFAKLLRAMPSASDEDGIDIVVEQHPFRRGDAGFAQTGLKLYVFDLLRRFEQQRIDTVMLPCFASHTFLSELTANSPLHIVDLVAALRDHVRRAHPDARRIGAIVPAVARERGLLEAYFRAPEFEVLYPRTGIDADAMSRDADEADALLADAVADLAAQRADVIVPGLTDLASRLDRFGSDGIPWIDCNLAYAQYAAAGRDRSDSNDAATPAAAGPAPFKIGVVGGVGPAATVDFLDKIVRNTPARNDQDHVKVVIEQNPQIPDRTGNLIGNGPDPTIALYATCKKLEASGADMIAIPCNTAHAFVERIQRYLGIPIVNMLHETVRYIRETFPELTEVGVLATSGTVSSGVYRDALEASGLRQVVPGEAGQARVMRSIYGEHGVKAGYTTGSCQDDIRAAVDELAARGVEVMILGCTELPLLLDSPQIVTASGKTVMLVDPTNVLAKRCVEHVLAGRGRAA